MIGSWIFIMKRMSGGGGGGPGGGIFNIGKSKAALFDANSQVSISFKDVASLEEAKEEIVGKYSGEDLTIGYNAAYLKDILSHITDEKLKMKLKTPISATLFIPEEQKENSDQTMLLMPIRLND